MDALRYALSRNGYALAYPPAKASLPVTLWGTYNPQQLRHALERQTLCKCVQRGNTLHLRYTKSKNFTDIVPNFTINPSTTVAGLTFTVFNTQDIVTGPDRLLPMLAKILAIAYAKPPQIRITAYLIDDNKAANLDFTLQPTATAITFGQITQLWKGITATINALESSDAIKTKFSTIAQTGQEITFADTDTREIQQYSYLPMAQQANSQSSLTSGLGQRTAGMTITLKANATKDYWTITGTIDDSNFNGTTALADMLTRSLTFTASMSTGELFRITSFQQNSADNEYGIPNMTGQYNNDHTKSHWSLWLQITPLYLNERNTQ